MEAARETILSVDGLPSDAAGNADEEIVGPDQSGQPGVYFVAADAAYEHGNHTGAEPTSIKIEPLFVFIASSALKEEANSNTFVGAGLDLGHAITRRFNARNSAREFLSAGIGRLTVRNVSVAHEADIAMTTLLIEIVAEGMEMD